ncbi:protein O15 [Cercopithecine betaherpesvirus 5]|uniref:Protein O15 n=1 Tax=Simian cytomegalovirus (strain Colburn) TaxID=50292 RepID=G8XTJ9_SCMVC|nr:protein O15 [Cercopithecine betaherpesvirus 5]AEV80491.1 protein O15 [Cercopithecine betaherpesvirus 5]
MDHATQSILIAVSGFIAVVIVLWIIFLLCHTKRTANVFKDFFTCYCIRSIRTRLRGEKFDSRYRNVYLRENLKKFSQDYKKVLLVCPKTKKTKANAQPEENVTVEVHHIAPEDKIQTIYVELPLMGCPNTQDNNNTPPPLPNRMMDTAMEKVALTIDEDYEYEEQNEGDCSSVSTPTSAAPAVNLPTVTPEIAAIIEAAVRSTLQILMTMQPRSQG